MNGYDDGYRYWSPVRAATWTWGDGYGGMRSDAIPTPFPGERRGEFGPGGGMYDAGFARDRVRGPVRGQAGEPGPYRGRPPVTDSARTRAAEIMTPDPEFVSPRTSLADATRVMAARDVGIVPVVETNGYGKLVGVITDRDIAVRAVARGAGPNAPVGEFMTERVQTVRPDAPVREVIATMSRERIRRLPVVDHDGRLVGIIAQADLAVDYAGFDPGREMEVAEMIEQISEPGRPRAPGTPYREWRRSGLETAPRPFAYW